MKNLVTALLCAVFLIGTGCGTEKTKIVEVEVPVPVPGPGPVPEPGPGNGLTSWARYQQLFEKNCARCHYNDDFPKSERGTRESRSEAMIRGLRMPPNANDMSPQDREEMLNFFSALEGHTIDTDG